MPSLLERVVTAAGPPDFEDDFSTLDGGWFSDGSSNLSVVDNRLVVLNTAAQSGGGVFHQDVAFADFMIQTEFTLLNSSPGGDFGIWFRAPVGPGGCSFVFRTIPGSANYNLYCEEGAGSTRSGVLQSVDASVGVSNTLAVVTIGNRITAFVNGAEVATITDPTWPTGYVGFRVGNSIEGTTVAVDSVKVWDLSGLDL
jgi:hypothetical protein